MSRQRPSAWRWVALHALLVVAVALVHLFGSPGLTLVIGGLLAAPVYLLIGLAEARSAPLWFTPLSFYFLWYAFGLGASAVYVGALLLRGEEIFFSLAALAPGDIATAYLTFLVGSVALHAGLRVLRPAAPREAGKTQERSRLVWLVLFWAVGLWAVFDPTRSGTIGTIGRFLQSAPLAAVTAFALTHRRFRLAPVLAMALLFAGVAGVFVANVMTYSKAYAMYSFLPLVWACLAERRYRRWLPPLAGALVVVYFGVIAPVLTAARYGPLGERESATERLLTTFEHWIAGQVQLGEGNFYLEQAHALLMRQFDPFAVAYLVGEVETYGYQQGETMEYARYAFIPRVLWPDKPEVTRGAWFSAYTGFAASPEEATTSLGITAAGELYWNFGLAGVVVGMLGLGVLLSALWRMSGSDPRADLPRMLLYVIVVVNMPNMAEFVSSVVSSVALLVLFGLACFGSDLAHRRPRTAVAIGAA